jgi:fluoride exporter
VTGHSASPPAAPGPADVAEARERTATRRAVDPSLLATVAAGGAIGAAARYGAGQAWPTDGGRLPVTTMVVNIVGCGLIGVLMMLLGEMRRPHRLLRPLVGTGVLGGLTTFSTYAVDLQRLLAGGHAWTATAYLVGTPVAALTAVWVSARATRRLLGRRR